MTSKLIQFQNGLKVLKKRNLNTKKKEEEKIKKVKHLTHINLKGITKGTPESDIHTYIILLYNQDSRKYRHLNIIIRI